VDFESKAFWGVGNGWAITGITRVIKALPESMSETRIRFEGYVREAIDGCLKHMRDDGLFHYVLDDPNTFIDTNPAQAIAYAIFRGVKAGWLDNSYLEPANKMRYAVHKKVDELGVVRDVSGAPTFDHQGIAPEAQAFFLLMEAAAEDV